MEQEDLRSITQRYFEEDQRLKKIIKDLEGQLKDAREEIVRLNELLQDLTSAYDQLKLNFEAKVQHLKEEQEAH